MKRLRAECDLLIVSIHWGFGSGETLAEYQAPLGAALIDAGADIVHGHHPHAIHAIGAHRGKPILFGLGTFMAQQFFLNSGPAAAAMRAGMSPDGYIALVDVEPNDGLRSPRCAYHARQQLHADARRGRRLRAHCPAPVALVGGARRVDRLFGRRRPRPANCIKAVR